MCDPIGAIGAFFGGGNSDGSGIFAKMLALQQKPADKPPASQGEKTPDQAAMRATTAPFSAAGTAGSTLLTGGAGIDSSLLKLGKSTLLGQ
jgi:hypothetical protein